MYSYRQTVKTAISYLVVFSGVMLGLSLYARYLEHEILTSVSHYDQGRDMNLSYGVTRRNPGVYAKVNHYVKHAPDYNLIFLGDSRTYFAFAPHLIDPLLRTNSYNMGDWAHWLPTQFPSFQDIVSHIPPNTTVVWSLGFQNLMWRGQVKKKYHIGLRNIQRYLSWGYPAREIRENIIDGIPGFKLVGLRYDFRRTLLQAAEHPFQDIFTLSPSETLFGAQNEEAFQAIQKEYENNPKIAFILPHRDSGTVTAASLFWRNGCRTFIEIDRSRYRKIQRQEEGYIALPKDDVFKPYKPYWKTLQGVLDLFQENGIKLVVNEIEEGPQFYQDKDADRIFRGYMRDTFRPYIESREIPYIRVDFTQLEMLDYFDRNHMNRRGVQKFTPLFVEQLKPLLMDKGKPNALL